MSKTGHNLKESFMGSVPGKIAAGALAFTTAFLPMTGKLGNTFGSSALAQDKAHAETLASNFKVSHPPTQQPDSSYSVKARDFSQFTNREARHTAGKASSGAIVILYQGSNKELMRQVVAGASEAKDGRHGRDPVYVRGMIIGKADPDFKGGADSYVLYVDGLPASNVFDASIYPRDTVLNAIYHANEKVLKPRLFSFNQPVAEQ